MEELYRHVLAVGEDFHRADTDEVANSLRSRALEIRRRLYGDRDPRVASAQSSLGLTAVLSCIVVSVRIG